MPTATALPQRPSSSQQQEQQEQQQPADVRSGSVAIIFRQASPYDFPDVGALRTAVFAPHLTMAQSRRLQNSIFERAMAAKEFVVPRRRSSATGAVRSSVRPTSPSSRPRRTLQETPRRIHHQRCRVAPSAAAGRRRGLLTTLGPPAGRLLLFQPSQRRHAPRR